MKKRLTKEEKLAKDDRRAKIMELLGENKSLQGIEELVTDLRKEIIEMMYDEELKSHFFQKRRKAWEFR